MLKLAIVFDSGESSPLVLTTLADEDILRQSALRVIRRAEQVAQDCEASGDAGLAIIQRAEANRMKTTLVALLPSLGLRDSDKERMEILAVH